MDKTGNVKTNIKDGIASITFGHPNSNSLPGSLLKKLAAEITSAGQNDEVKVIMLQSEGDKAFCAGASFDELAAIESFEQGNDFFMGFAKVINAMRKAPKLIITAVQGRAVGGGVGIIAASDYVFATHNAAVKLSELALGIGPFVVGPAIERKIGLAAFSQMSIDYEWYDAEWARDKGLYVEIDSDVDTLDAVTTAFAKKMAKGSTRAMAELKKVLWQGTEDWDELLEKRAEISGKLVASDFTKNYIREFKEKGKERVKG